MLSFFAAQLPSLVAMGWRRVAGRIIGGASWLRLGHTVRLIPPAYVKPFVKRAEERRGRRRGDLRGAQRPSMRFTPVKDEEQQASGVVFRARDLLVRQRTQTINALRGHLTEYGHAAAKGVPHVARLIERIEDPDTALPQAARVGATRARRDPALSERADRRARHGDRGAGPRSTRSPAG